MSIKEQNPGSAKFLLQLTRSLVNEDLDRIIDERLKLRTHITEKRSVISAEDGSRTVFDFHDNIINHRGSNSF